MSIRCFRNYLQICKRLLIVKVIAGSGLHLELWLNIKFLLEFFEFEGCASKKLRCLLELTTSKVAVGVKKALGKHFVNTYVMVT